MDETATLPQEPITQQAQAPEATPASAPADPFQLEESSFATLTPEQRAGLDPILEAWRKRATDEISKRESQVSEKYKPVEERAKALERLTQYQPFVQWWQAQQKSALEGANSGAQQTAIAGTKPNDVASAQEWQEALWEASQGSPEKLQGIQSRMSSAWATPIFQQLSDRQKHVELQIEMKDLFDRHPDAKELDEIGIDSKTKEGVSLLESGLDWAERNGRSLEDGYAMAKRWADEFNVRAQQKAMGLVNQKKQEVTAGNSTAKNTSSVVEVRDADELLKRSLEAQMSGNKDVRFVIKGR